MTQSPSLDVVVRAIRPEARGVCSLELVPADASAEALPSFTAGAHIDLHLPNGLTRSYSLSELPADGRRYVVTVGRDANSRGGSSWIHDSLRENDRLRISAPRNHFPLFEAAAHSVLIAGGIGITPIRAMAERLHELGRSWRLIYCCRDRESAALMASLQKLDSAESMHFHFDREAGGKVFNLEAAIRSGPPDAHFYCCGPTPMLAAFEDATRHLKPEQVHREYFSAKAPAGDRDIDAESGFDVELARTGRILRVGPGCSILDALLDDGIAVEYSCMDGICGSCKLPVLAGMPDHRDQVLTDAQRASGRSIMVCCSRARTPTLVLDI